MFFFSIKNQRERKKNLIFYRRHSSLFIVCFDFPNRIKNKKYCIDDIGRKVDMRIQMGKKKKNYDTFVLENKCNF
jgi:hypothetical protein